MTDTGLTRRRALTGAASLGVGLPLLAACGDDGEGSEGSGNDPGGSASSSGSGAGSGGGGGGGASGVASTADVPVGGGLVIADEQVVITQPSEGEFLAFSAVCTHQGCLVADVSDTINCPCHASSFSIEDGSPTGGPASSPLEQRQVTVEGDQIVLS